MVLVRFRSSGQRSRNMICLHEASCIIICLAILGFCNSLEEKVQVSDVFNWAVDVNGTGTAKWAPGSNKQFYVCANGTNTADSYLSIPYIKTSPATEIRVNVSYGLEDCVLLNSKCSHSIQLYTKRSDVDLTGKVTPMTQTFGLVNIISNTTVLNKGKKAWFSKSIILGMEGKLGIYLSFRALNTCGSIFGLNISYYKCPRMSVSLVKFKSTPAPNITSAINRVSGECVENSVPITAAGNNFMDCYNNGTTKLYGGCHCVKGHERKGDICSGCKSGYYKSSPGSEPCSKCGKNTAHASTADSCPCKPDFYRPAQKEHNSTESCHSVPTQPSNVKVVNLMNTSATLTWDKPAQPGTLPDIYYSITCNNDSIYCNDVTYTPTTSRFTSQSVQLHNLKSFSSYNFAVLSENDVSTGARKKYGWKILFQTKPGISSDVTNIQAGLLGNSLTILWNPPMFKGDKTVYYDARCDGYQNQETFYPFVKYTVTKSAFLRCQIRVKNSVGKSRWITKIFNVNLEDKNTDGGSSDNLQTILLATVSVVIIAIILLIVFFIKMRMKRRSNHARERVCWRPPTNEPNTYDPVTISLGTRAVQGNQDNLAVEVEEPLYIDIEDDAFEFSIDDLGVVRILGEGQFGIVYLATAKSISGNKGTSDVAVKMLKESAGENDLRDFQTELNLMKKLKSHPNVVRLLGCCTTKAPQCIILEFLPNGSLLEFLRKSRGYDGSSLLNLHTATLSSRQLLQFTVMIANGMNHLSSQNVVHRDLACRNILVDHKLVCKISDLGLARELGDIDGVYKRGSQAKLPVKWMAYESLFNGISTIKSDVWSFGIVLYEILTIGDIPYPEYKSKNVIDLIQHGYRMQKPPHCSDDLYRIMSRCWEKDAFLRPSFGGLKSSLEKLLNDDDHVYLNMDKYNDDLYVHFGSNEDDVDVVVPNND